MVADQYGYVHAFWSESGMASEGRSIIQYARFDGVSWTEPIDVYVTGPNSEITQVEAAVDQSGILHLAWTGGFTGPLYYGTAPALDALSARQWQRPRVLKTSLHRMELQLDSNGMAYILYTDPFSEEKGIYIVSTDDEGKTWSFPVRVDSDTPNGYEPDDVQFAIDSGDVFHAVWSDYDVSDANKIKWIRYARSIDSGRTWSTPETIDEVGSEGDELRAAGPRMIVQGQTVHVIWARVNAGPQRQHRFSVDDGQNWSGAQWIFGGLNGQAGDALAVDGAGRVHFIGQIRFPQGIYHAYWDGTRWTQPDLIYLIRGSSEDVIGNRIHAQGIHLAVRAGNQLVTVFSNLETQPRPLYTMYRTLEDVPPARLAALPVPSASPVPSLSPTPPEAAPADPTAAPAVARVDTGRPSPPGQSAASDASPDRALWLGILPVLLFIGGSIALRLVRRR
ncbi:MAG: glycoside hydrolase [Ardenticatenaceae bacterium]|nr:glycoside hydrolase [Ardenticatenaceae bacterium]HBY94958.1 hypothetical protein [Chloroflexota bacterium]